MEWYQGPWVIGISLGLNVLGVGLAAFFGLASRRRRRLAYTTSGAVLSSRAALEVPGISILYGGQEVPRVAVSNIAVWNAGADSIAPRDRAQRDPFRLEMPRECRVLGFQVTERTRDAVSAEVSLVSAEKLHRAFPPVAPDRPVCLLEFDHLDPGDGFTVQVIHTGESP